MKIGGSGIVKLQLLILRCLYKNIIRANNLIHKG